MKKHLSAEHFVDAVDGVLDTAEASHLLECDQCRAELAAMQAMLEETRSLPASEPSPLFWDHFSARVAQATAQQPTRTPWFMTLRPLAALTMAAGIIAFAIVSRPSAPVLPAPTGSALAIGTLSDDDGEWGLLEGLASELDWSDVAQVATPAEGTADAMLGELTADQRDALVKLLQKETGDSE